MQRCESLSAQGAPPFDSLLRTFLVLVLSGFATRGHVPQLPHLSVVQSAQVCVSVKAPQALPPFAAAFAIVLLRERLPLEHVPQLSHAFSSQCTHDCTSFKVHAAPPFCAGVFTVALLILSGLAPDEHVPHAPHALASHAVHAWFSVRPHAAPPFAAACATVLLRSRFPFEHALQLPQGFALQSPHA